MCGDNDPIDLTTSDVGEEMSDPGLIETGDDEENSTSTTNSDTKMLTTNDELVETGDDDVGSSSSTSTSTSTSDVEMLFS